MFGIVHSGSHRNGIESRWQARALVYALSSSLAAVAVGMLLGTVGRSVPADARAAIASVVAILAIAAGILDLASHRLPLVQCNRETSQRWLRTRPIRWATVNGATLGIGATSRIGFWLWYLVPLGAVLVGSPVLGGLIYGIYGFARGWSVWLLLLGPFDRVLGGDTGVWLMSRDPVVRRLAAGHLLLVGVAVVIAVGV